VAAEAAAVAVIATAATKLFRSFPQPSATSARCTTTHDFPSGLGVWFVYTYIRTFTYSYKWKAFGWVRKERKETLVKPSRAPLERLAASPLASSNLHDIR
jgi:hypothetical protein